MSSKTRFWFPVLCAPPAPVKRRHDTPAHHAGKLQVHPVGVQLPARVLKLTLTTKMRAVQQAVQALAEAVMTLAEAVMVSAVPVVVSAEQVVALAEQVVVSAAQVVAWAEQVVLAVLTLASAAPAAHLRQHSAAAVVAVAAEPQARLVLAVASARSVAWAASARPACLGSADPRVLSARRFSRAPAWCAPSAAAAAVP